MVPDSDDAIEGEDAMAIPKPDGGTVVEGDAALYTTVRGAVKDALLEVIGLLLQLGIGLAILLVGAWTIADATSGVGFAMGGALVLAGIAVALPVLRLVQPRAI